MERTRRWVVDAGLVLFAYFVSAMTLVGELVAVPRPALAWLVVDVVAAVLTPALVLLRRRFPVQVIAVLLLATTFTATAGCATAIAVVTIRGRYQQALTVSALALAAVTVNFTVRGGMVVYWPIFGILVVTGAVELGLFLRLRSRLAREAAARIERAQAAEQARIEHARRSERLRIARDMHDALAHRISLLSVHAGALAFRPDAPAAEIAATAEVIRGASHDVLTDLQKVIGVLRDDGALPEPDLRTPGWSQIGELVDDAVRSGQLVHTTALPGATVPAAAGRTAYRVVQEGLTNARKHAPGQPVRVQVLVGDGLTIVVSNELEPAAGEGVPGARLGLIGLRERVELLGGKLSHGTVDGTFRLTAWLPWAP